MLLNFNAKLCKSGKRRLVVFAGGKVFNAGFACRECTDERGAMRNGFIGWKGSNCATKLRFHDNKKEKATSKLKLPLCCEERRLSVHFFVGALSTTLAARTLQTVVYRRLREKRARTKFFQYAGTFILFLEAFEHLINRFVF